MLSQIKLRQLNIPRLRNLEIPSRPRHHRYLDPRPFQQTSLIRSRKPSASASINARSQQPKQRPLRSLRLHNPLPGIVAVTIAPSAVRSTCLIVSTAGSPTIAAPCFTTASIVRSSSPDRSAAAPHRAPAPHRPHRTPAPPAHSHRLLPMISALHHMHPRPRLCSIHLRLHPLPLRARTATHTASTRGTARNARTDLTSTGTPPISKNCFGATVDAPPAAIRVPIPAAGRITNTRITSRSIQDRALSHPACSTSNLSNISFVGSNPLRSYNGLPNFEACSETTLIPRRRASSTVFFSNSYAVLGHETPARRKNSAGRRAWLCIHPVRRKIHHPHPCPGHRPALLFDSPSHITPIAEPRPTHTTKFSTIACSFASSACPASTNMLRRCPAINSASATVANLVSNTESVYETVETHTGPNHRHNSQSKLGTFRYLG